jgi:hypothetical protein
MLLVVMAVQVVVLEDQVNRVELDRKVLTVVQVVVVSQVVAVVQLLLAVTVLAQMAVLEVTVLLLIQPMELQLELDKTLAEPIGMLVVAEVQAQTMMLTVNQQVETVAVERAMVVESFLSREQQTLVVAVELLVQTEMLQALAVQV